MNSSLRGRLRLPAWSTVAARHNSAPPGKQPGGKRASDVDVWGGAAKILRGGSDKLKCRTFHERMRFQFYARVQRARLKWANHWCLGLDDRHLWLITRFR
jgi:hypothetical protein